MASVHPTWNFNDLVDNFRAFSTPKIVLIFPERMGWSSRASFIWITLYQFIMGLIAILSSAGVDMGQKLEAAVKQEGVVLKWKFYWQTTYYAGYALCSHHPSCCDVKELRFIMLCRFWWCITLSLNI